MLTPPPRYSPPPVPPWNGSAGLVVLLEAVVSDEEASSASCQRLQTCPGNLITPVRAILSYQGLCRRVKLKLKLF